MIFSEVFNFPEGMVGCWFFLVGRWSCSTNPSIINTLKTWTGLFPRLSHPIRCPGVVLGRVFQSGASQQRIRNYPVAWHPTAQLRSENSGCSRLDGWEEGLGPKVAGGEVLDRRIYHILSRNQASLNENSIDLRNGLPIPRSLYCEHVTKMKVVDSFYNKRFQGENWRDSFHIESNGQIIWISQSTHHCCVLGSETIGFAYKMKEIWDGNPYPLVN